ncbi:MAG: hypothetical protein AAFO96_03605 [Bacteroidota bacterium]
MSQNRKSVSPAANGSQLTQSFLVAGLRQGDKVSGWISLALTQNCKTFTHNYNEIEACHEFTVTQDAGDPAATPPVAPTLVTFGVDGLGRSAVLPASGEVEACDVYDFEDWQALLSHKIGIDPGTWVLH